MHDLNIYVSFGRMPHIFEKLFDLPSVHHDGRKHKATMYPQHVTAIPDDPPQKQNFFLKHASFGKQLLLCHSC